MQSRMLSRVISAAAILIGPLPVGGVVFVGYRVVAFAGKTVWDGVYTGEQAARGEAVYQKNCAFCHLPDLRGEGFAPALIEETFSRRWEAGILGDLFIIIKETMPADRPKTLPDDEVAAVVAYLLKMNSYPVGQEELSTDVAVLKQIRFTKPDPSDNR
jgi:mono/diheme cytochrome c family protein